MQEIYRVSGTVNPEFVGQITYTVSLKECYRKVDVGFSFDKRVFEEEDVTEELREAVAQEVLDRYQQKLSGDEVDHLILHDMKTEMHPLCMLNDTFIGCMHKQLQERHMIWDGAQASEGCIPVDTFSGVLKVTILVFNVLKADTHYTLIVRAEV